MKTAHLTWADVQQQQGENTFTVFYDGLTATGKWYDDHMMKKFSGCELLRLSRTGYQVMRWPENMTQCRDWREHKNEDNE